ncbi:MAG: hypothetical protein FWD03_08435 [Defluviitaleaceae bacterium]|nr:hypothetical protein [Defluviitaleaceae bacterium]
MNKNANSCDVCWIGNAGWRIRFGSINVLIDPDLEESPERISLEGIPDDCISAANLEKYCGIILWSRERYLRC